MNILDAMADSKLFGKTFKPRLLRGDTWGPWRVFLAALFGLPIEDADRELITKHTERSDIPTADPFTEAYVICGRRGGKSIISALVVAFVSCLRDYSDVLAPGEVGVVLILASDRKQAGVIFGYVKALIEGAPPLRKMIVNVTKETIELANHVTIQVHTSSYRAVRGYSIVCCVADELAFWSSEDGSNPASEILNAVRPGMSSIPGAILLGTSSPYSKRGVLFDIFREHYGKPAAPALVWKAASRDMNATINPLLVAASRLSDPSSARSEWDADFRDDLETFLSLAVVEAGIVPHRYELPRKSGVSYVAFVDPSGGRADSMVLAIAHLEGTTAILDLIRERAAPFSPDDAVSEFVGLLQNYGIGTVVGDAYGGDWPREGFRKQGIQYRVAEKTRSELYLELLPLLMSGRCELLDNVRLKNQLVGLERRTGRTGKDAIDHIAGQHDDVANATAGCIFEAAGKTYVLGLTDLYTEELAKRTAQADGDLLQYHEATDGGCPKCRHKGIASRGGAWLCTNCAYRWKGPAPSVQPRSADPVRQVGQENGRSHGTPATTDGLRCPLCKYHGIAVRGPLGRCSMCGHTFRLEPVEEPVPGRKAALDAADSGPMANYERGLQRFRR